MGQGNKKRNKHNRKGYKSIGSQVGSALGGHLSKQGKLTVCADATYTHPNEIIRSDFKFGVKEMLNRFKFVKKNKLSIKKFYVTAFLKCISNLNRIFSIRSNSITKLFGNIIGIILCILN